MVGPIDNAAIFAGLTHNHTKKERRTIAFKACLISAIVLILFPIVGDKILYYIDVEFYALQLGGGVLLLILGIQIVMNDYESAEELATKHKHTKDLSVFPLAIPLIAGPGAITQSLILFGKTNGDTTLQGLVLLCIAILMVVSYVMFLLAGQITRLLGDKGAETLARILGIFLTALAMNIIVDGFKASGLFASA